jgi:hypothetical protein
MIPKFRSQFNSNFSENSYQLFIDKVNQHYDYKIPFRVAESPFFIPNLLKNRLVEACNEINEVICAPGFKQLTDGAFFNPNWIVPNEDEHTTFLQMDFGITIDDKGDPMPKLIEIQGFPSVYFFQEFIAKYYRDHFGLSDELSTYLDPNMDEMSYVDLLKSIIVGDSDPRNVVMLEIEPELQNTYIDFICTADKLGIKVLCYTKVIKKGKQLFYLDAVGNEVSIHKIYNRIIFDELEQRTDLVAQFNFTDDLDVEWIGHPNWFFKISKYTMPLLKGKYVPKCYYLDQLETVPADLENYVLKPLYSFSGSGVVIDVTKEIVDAVEDRKNYLLQEKVTYEPVLKSPNPDEPVKCEIRMLMLWGKDMEKPIIVNNLVRLSKGKMIGVKFNKNKDWVGGSVGFFEKD